MKTKEELNALKEEVETLSKKLHELTPEELEKVVGGIILSATFKCPICGATKVKTVNSDSRDSRDNRGDVWCDSCNKAMDKITPWT